MTRDGIIGYWNGKSACTPKSFEEDVSYIEKLRLPAQATLLDHDLKSRIVVAGAIDPKSKLQTAKLMVRGFDTFLDVLHITRPSEDYFQDQFRCVRTYADLRTDRLSELHVQLTDILSFIGSIAHPDGRRRKYSQTALTGVQGLLPKRCLPRSSFGCASRARLNMRQKSSRIFKRPIIRRFRPVMR